MKENIEKQERSEPVEKLPSPEKKAPEEKAGFLEKMRRRLSTFASNIRWGWETAKHAPPEALEDIKPGLDIIEVSADVAREIITQNTALETPPAREHDIERGEESQQFVVERENPFELLLSVRMANHLPIIKNGKLMIETPLAATDGDVARPTLHFTMNEKVGDHTEGEWGSAPYGIFAPMDQMVKLNGLPYGFGKMDTYWLKDEGVLLPEHATTILTKKGEENPNLQFFKEQCEKENIEINIVEVDAISDEAVNDLVAQLGYHSYGAEKEDEHIRQKFGIETGGYGAHNNSWLHGFERTFMHGSPKLASRVISKEYLAVRTPADQLSQLKIHGSKLPEKLYEQYQSIAAARLELLLENPEMASAFFRAHLKIAETDSSKRGEQEMEHAETRMFSEIIQIISDGTEFGEQFKAAQPQVHEKFTDAVSRKIGSTHISEKAHDNLVNAFIEKFDTLPKDFADKVIRKISATGGPDGIAVLFQLGGSLTELQKENIIQGITNNPAAIKELSPEEGFQYFVGTIRNPEERKRYEEVGLGEEFFRKIIQMYG